MGYENNSLSMIEANRFEQWFRLTMLRMMIEHRDIKLRDLARVMNKSLNYVTVIYSGYESTRTSVEAYDSLLDQLDAAVSLITQENEELCSCPDWYLDKLRRTIKRGRLE